MVAPHAAVGRGASLRDQRPRVGRPAADPLGDVRDLLVGKPVALGRHLEVVVPVADRVDDEAVGGLSRRDRRPRVAAVEHPLARVQHEAALDLVGQAAVALVAAVGEDRPDPRLEELEVTGGDRRRRRRHGRRRRGRDVRGKGRREGGQRHGGAHGLSVEVHHARIGWTTFPATSVSRKSRPAWRYVSRSWSKPSRCRIVAWKSWT